MAESPALIDHDTPELAEAMRAWASGERDRALLILDRGVAKDPSNVRVLINAARSFGLHHQPERMRALLARAADVAGGNPAVWVLIAQTFRMLRLTPEAIDAYERALGGGYDDGESCVELGMLYELVGRLDEADAMLERASHSEGLSPLLRYARAMVARKRKDSDKARELLIRVAEMDRTPVRTPVINHAWAQLALLYDARGEYAEAHKAMQQSKHAHEPAVAPIRAHAARERAHIHSIAQAVHGADPERWFGNEPADDRVAVLAGYPRSGTTLLEAMLDAHPDVCTVEERGVLGEIVIPGLYDAEGEHAGERIATVSGRHLKRARERYRKAHSEWLGEPIGGRVLVDKNPGVTPLLPLFIRMFPGGTVLMALRDPRDVLLSCMMRYVDHDPSGIEYQTIETAARRYAAEMDVWLKLRPLIPGRYVEIRYEDLVRDPEVQCRRATEALGVAWDAGLLDYRQKMADKAIASPSAEAVRAPINTGAIGRWKNYASMFEPVAETLGPYIDAFGYEA